MEEDQEEENLREPYDDISGDLGTEGTEFNHKFKSDIGCSKGSSKDDSRDPSEPLEPLGYSDDTEDTKAARVLMDALRLKITNTLHHAWDSQRISCQALVAVLASILSEVSGEWWHTEMTSLFEELGGDEDRGY